MTEKMKVGIIGCGNIARGAYVNGIRNFDFLDLTACADSDPRASGSLARDMNIPKSCSVDELLGDKNIDIVLNLTTPGSHAPVNLKILEAGKHVYVEKPFALDMNEAAAVLKKAEAKKLRVSAAPDTFLGSGIQTARKAVDDGLIGEATAGVLFMACGGHETWHPSPEFYYKKGGGPLLDMGPYYLTAAVNILGPVSRVSGMAKKTLAKRTITSKPLNGKVIDVDVNTHITAGLEFVSGAMLTLIMSFDVNGHNLPCIELYGTKGSLVVPDPNGFGGAVKLFDKDNGAAGWREVPPVNMSARNSRGIGAADMARAIMEGRPHRASGQMASHVLEVMLAVEQSARRGKAVKIASSFERPEALLADL